ncbi:hypothetical protein PTSG_10121, partial [Salpingoeca rosetta]
MSAEENELFDTVRRTAPRYRCTIALPMAALMSGITAHGISVDPLRTCSSFKRPSLPAIYRAIRTAIRDGPYSTDDLSKACLFVPSTDVSCWCEDCMHGTYSGNIESMHPVSAAIYRDLSRLAYWNEGRNHILFEYSDAPCLPGMQNTPFLQSEFHHRDGLDVSMPLFSMVTFIHTGVRTRSARTNRNILVTFRGTTKSARSDVMRNHLPKLHNRRDIVLVCACRWFGEERMGREGEEEEFNKYTYTELALETKFGLIVEGFGYHSFSPTRTCWTGRRSASAFPEHRLLELPRILRSIPDEVVEMMQRRVVFVFEEFFKSLSTQVHTALESARINLFSGDNAWQAGAGCLQLGTGGDSTSCTFGGKQQQQQRRCARTSRMRERSRILATRASCTRLTHGMWRARMPAAGAAATPLIRLSLLCSCSVPICVSKEQLWTHTYMVMVGTFNHSDAVMCRCVCVSAITLRPTPAPIWREADIAHVTRSHDEQQLMSGCIVDELAICLSSIPASLSSSLVTNSSGCCRGCGGCDVRRCAVASHDDAASGGECTVAVLFPSPHDTSRAIHAHTNVPEKKAQGETLALCVCALLRRDRDSRQH